MQLVEVTYLWWYVNQDGGCGAGEGGDGELSGEDTQAIADLGQHPAIQGVDGQLLEGNKKPYIWSDKTNPCIIQAFHAVFHWK